MIDGVTPRLMPPKAWPIRPVMKRRFLGGVDETV